MPELRRPRALFLDFGGVVVDAASRPEWIDELAVDVHAMLQSATGPGWMASEAGAMDETDGTGRALAPLTVADITIDIRAAAAADSAWKDSASRRHAPVELTAVEFWAEFVACDWPEPLRRIVAAHATQLCYRMGTLRSTRNVRPGIDELLRTAQNWHVPVAIVSNSLSGAVHRDFFETSGYAQRFAAQVYSDEVGVRKPNPKMLTHAAELLHVPVADGWFVGDTPDRDVVCGRRAGAGAVILMESETTYQVPYRIRDEPDATVRNPAELTVLLNRACSRVADAK